MSVFRNIYIHAFTSKRMVKSGGDRITEFTVHVFRPKFCMQVLSLPCLLHAPSILTVM